MVVLPFRLTLLSINESVNIYSLSLISSSRLPAHGHQKHWNVNELHSIQPIQQPGEATLGRPDAFHILEPVTRAAPDCKIVNEMTSEYTLILLLRRTRLPETRPFRLRRNACGFSK